MGFDDGAEGHGVDRARRNVDLKSFVLRVVGGGVQDAVEVLLLDAARIDQHQRANAVSG